MGKPAEPAWSAGAAAGVVVGRVELAGEEGGGAVAGAVVGAVVVVVNRVAVVVDEVGAVDVVHETVGVVVDPVAGDLAGVVPHVGGQVGVSVLDAGVGDADDNAAVAAGNVPGVGGVDVGA